MFCCRRSALLVLVLVTWASRIDALDPNRKLSQYVRQRWGNDKGLPGEVDAITQTPDGYLWVGTAKGLFRFDGNNFSPVSDQGASQVPLTNVLALMVDDQGHLIVRLPERNLLRYLDGTFENTLYPLRQRELAITAMFRTRAGFPLVAGIVNGVMKYRSGQFESIAPSSSLPSSPVISLTQSADGRIWLGSREAGLFYLNGSHAVAVGGELPSQTVNALLEEGRDLWIGTDSGLARWNGTSITTEGVPAELRRIRVLTILRDRNSNLWVGTSSGLYRVSGGRCSRSDNAQDGSGAAINTLFEDAEGDLWAGGPWGIECLRDGTFTTFGKPEGLPANSAGSIFADSDDRVWFAPLTGGLSWLDGGETKHITTAGLDKDVVYSIAGTHGDIWIGRQQGGLTHLISQGADMKAETHTQKQGLAQNSVYSVYQSRDGSVWAGTLSGGVSRLHAGQFTTYSNDSGLGANTVASILEGSDETMWFATPNGLRAFAKGKWRGYTTKEGLPSDDVNCLTEDSRGILWIGTAAGLAFLSANGITAPRNGPAALREPIFGMAEDASGGLWIATASHVVRLARDKLLRGVLAEGDQRDYSMDDGLRSVAGTRRDRSVMADGSGRIWFSLSNGLSVVDPAHLTSGSGLTLVHVQTISADNRPIDFRRAVQIPAPPRRITFAFSGVSLWEPDRVRYRYRLDGYDSAWSEPTAGREAAYTNLGPGTYRFRVVGRNPEGVWNTEEAVVGFDVLPLFWQTWWFRAACIVATGLLLLALYRLKLRQLDERLHVRFEERLAERTRIAQELHDTLLQGFLSTSLQLQVLAGKLHPDSPTKEPLNRMIEQMRQVIDEGRNAVRGLRSSQSLSSDLEKAFLHIRQEFQIGDQVEFRVIVDGEPRPLNPFLRDEVYRIGREAVVNAIRHSHANAIDLEIKYAPTKMRVRVSDNGCGIDPHVLQVGRDGHWGLPGMRERAEKIGGRLRIYSQVSGGTEVELSVPGHVAFTDSSSNLLWAWFARKTRAKR